MGAVYASVADIEIFEALSVREQEQVEVLLERASAKLRLTAKQYGVDLDAMIEQDDDLLPVVADTVINCVRRALSSYSNDDITASQTSQSALGYSVSMTYINAGQSLYYLKNELSDLGILRQRYGAVEVYANEDSDQGN